MTRQEKSCLSACFLLVCPAVNESVAPGTLLSFCSQSWSFPKLPLCQVSQRLGKIFQEDVTGRIPEVGRALAPF